MRCDHCNMVNSDSCDKVDGTCQCSLVKIITYKIVRLLHTSIHVFLPIFFSNMLHNDYGISDKNLSVKSISVICLITWFVLLCFN